MESFYVMFDLKCPGGKSVGVIVVCWFDVEVGHSETNIDKADPPFNWKGKDNERREELRGRKGKAPTTIEGRAHLLLSRLFFPSFFGVRWIDVDSSSSSRFSSRIGSQKKRRERGIEANVFSLEISRSGCSFL